MSTSVLSRASSDDADSIMDIKHHTSACTLTKSISFRMSIKLPWWEPELSFRSGEARRMPYHTIVPSNPNLSHSIHLPGDRDLWILEDILMSQNWINGYSISPWFAILHCKSNHWSYGFLPSVVMPAIRWGTATLLFALAPTWTGTFGTRHVAMSR